MSFAIDLATNGQELKKAYNKVLSSDPDIKWAIFGYSNDALDVQETGASLKEFCSEFDDSQAQYGVVQVDHNGINKIVLVGWVGDGTPSKKRIAFNAHFASVARYFPGYHVQMFAAESDELTPQIIASKVASGAGANYTAQSRKPKYFQSETGANEDDWGDAKPLEVKEKPELSKVPTAYNKHKIEVNTQKTKPSVSKPSSSVKDTSKPIDLKSARDDGSSDNKFSSTKVEKLEPHYKPVGKVNLKEIHENERKQAEAQGKEVEQFGSLQDRMKAFKLGVEQAKPQFDTNTRSVSRSKPSGTSNGAKSTETSPWATKSTGQSKAPSSSSTPSWKKNPNAHSAAVASSAPDSTDESDEDQEVTNVKDARSKFLNAGKEQPKTAPATAPSKESGMNSFASLTSRFANKSSESKQPETKSETKSSAKTVPAAKSPEPEPETVSEDEAESSAGTATVVTAYEAEDPEDEISLEAGETVTEIEKLDDFWWSGTNSKGQSGLFPKENVKENVGGSAAPKKSLPPPAPARKENPPPPPARKDSPEAPPSIPSRKEESPAPPTPARNLPPLPPKRDTAPAPAPPARKQPEPEPESKDAQGEEGVVYVVEAYDADREADDEISLRVGEKITNVDRLDEFWWAGTNSQGQHGLFPVENVSETPNGSASKSASTVGQAAGVSAIALHDNQPDEDDELPFSKGDKIVNIEFPSADWWSGELNGRVGLFPPDFVELQ